MKPEPQQPDALRHRAERREQVAPGLRELRALEKALAADQLAGKWRDVDVAISESLQALSAPRLHRSP